MTSNKIEVIHIGDFKYFLRFRSQYISVLIHISFSVFFFNADLIGYLIVFDKRLIDKL